MKIIVTGSHRSGTTWIGQTIAQAKNAIYVHEPFNIEYTPRGNTLEIENFYDDLGNSALDVRGLSEIFDNRYRPLREFLAQTSWKQKIATIRPLSRSIQRKFAKIEIFKDPFLLFALPVVSRRYSIRGVISVRHPCAFVFSLIRMNWDFDFRHFTRQSNLMRSLSEETRQLIGGNEDILSAPVGGRSDAIFKYSVVWRVIHERIRTYSESDYGYYIVRHEDFALSPMESFEKLFNELGLEFNDRIKNYVLSTTSSSAPAENASGRHEYGSRDSKALVKSWRQKASDDEIDTILSTCGRAYSYFYE